MRGAPMPAKVSQVFETGSEPEFVTNHVVKWENAGNGMVRVYFSSVRGKNDRMEFSVVTSPTELAQMARSCMRIAADFHTHITLNGEDEVVAH